MQAGSESFADNPSMPDSPVIPVLHYPDVQSAVSWLCRVFGFSERLRIGGHRAQLATCAKGGYIVVADGGSAEQKTSTPNHSIMIRIRNVDEHYATAKLAGAEILRAPETFPFGERQYTAVDPGGHVWAFSETVANVDPATWGGELV